MNYISLQSLFRLVSDDWLQFSFRFPVQVYVWFCDPVNKTQKNSEPISSWVYPRWAELLRFLTQQACFLIVANNLLPATSCVRSSLVHWRFPAAMFSGCVWGWSRVDCECSVTLSSVLAAWCSVSLCLLSDAWGCSPASCGGCELTSFLRVAWLWNHVYFIKMAVRGTL